MASFQQFESSIVDRILNYHAYTFLHINSDRMFVADFGYGAFLAKATAFSECDHELRL